MFKDFSKWVTSKGDWNHVIVSLLIMMPFSSATLLPDVSPVILYYVAFALMFFYLGKEYQENLRLGILKAFCINLWTRHNRRQTILAYAAMWGYAFVFNKFIYGLIA